jgi:hypothetical protein
MSPRENSLSALLLLVIWAALVVLHLTPAEPYVQTLRELLIAAGVFKATVTFPGLLPKN